MTCQWETATRSCAIVEERVRTACSISSWTIRNISIAKNSTARRGADYPDNAERYAEFARAAIELAKQVWMPDVIHCHDWQSALVPVLLRTRQPGRSGAPRRAGDFHHSQHGVPRTFSARGAGANRRLPESVFRIDGLEFFGKVNYLKGGLLYSDYLTTVSRQYAEEIQTPEYGHGLDGVVRARADRLVGILNGVDYRCGVRRATR